MEKQLRIEPVKGQTRALALASSKEFTTVLNDATQSWKKAGSPTGALLEEFAQSYTDKKGDGAFSITTQKAVPDSRIRPYKVKDIANKTSRHYHTKYQIVVQTPEGELVVGQEDMKHIAKKAAVAYVAKNKVSADVKPVKVVDKGEPLSLTVEYVPSDKAQEGEYILFGRV